MHTCAGGDGRLADPFLLPHAWIRRPLVHGQRHVPGQHAHHQNNQDHKKNQDHQDDQYHQNGLTAEHCLRTGGPIALPLHRCSCPWIGEYLCSCCSLLLILSLNWGYILLLLQRKKMLWLSSANEPTPPLITNCRLEGNQLSHHNPS